MEIVDCKMTVVALTQVAESGGKASHGKDGVTAVKAGSNPLYSMQAFLEGKMKLEDFARSEKERPQVPHNVFDESLPIIDVAALKHGTPEERASNVASMLEAAKSWGFFKITNHGVPLKVVW